MKKLFLSAITLLIFSISYGQFGNALSTDGIQDYIIVPDNNALDLTDDFTVECWVQAKIVDTIHVFRKGWCSGSDDSYYLSIMNGRVRWHWNYSGSCSSPSSYETDSVVVHNGDCAHITVVHSSNEIKIYVNNVLIPGTLISGNYSTVHNSSNDMSIAAYRFLSGTYGIFYWGTVDELRFWNYKLTQQEIIDYSNAPLTGNEPGLIAYFDMEDSGVGTSLTITNKATVSGNIVGTAYGSSTSPSFVTSCITTGTSNRIINQNSGFNIYPNPADNVIQIDGAGNYKIQLFDIIGNKLIEKYLFDNATLDISKLKQGTYIIKITQKETTLCHPIIKTN